MNILFLGQYRGPESDGWSIAARRYLDALLLTGHNIVCKPIYMGGNGGSVSKIIEKAEQKRVDKIDVIIQNCLPDIMEKHDGYNIGIFFSETRHLENTGWIDKLNLMDELWVSCLMEKDSLQESGVKSKISVVPVPYKVLIHEPKKLEVPELKNKFVFYYIGEYNERKNIIALVKAFHREFSPEEDVTLLIKTNSPELKNEINQWREYSRTRKQYIPEVIIDGQVPEDFILDIHETGDCFVCPSRGEGFCLPIMDALYYNNPVLCTDNTYPVSIFGNYITPVNSMEIPVDCKQPPLQHIYTGNETWMEIDILDLQKNMRDKYDNRHIFMSNDYIKQEFLQQSIVNKMKGLLACL
jgi:glycosyltransferase involved in cell wall biosynthesis